MSQTCAALVGSTTQLFRASADISSTLGGVRARHAPRARMKPSRQEGGFVLLN
jgi:hypothetical protein